MRTQKSILESTSFLYVIIIPVRNHSHNTFKSMHKIYFGQNVNKLTGNKKKKIKYKKDIYFRYIYT